MAARYSRPKGFSLLSSRYDFRASRDPRVTGRYAVKTYVNTSFDEWLALANAEFKRLGCEEPTPKTAFDAYELGESPETFAAYVANS
jgi:hypothetical protein